MSKRDKVMRGSLRNERTGKTAGSIAGRLLKKLERLNGNTVYVMDDLDFESVCSKDELQTVLASCLTQRPTGKPIEATARPKKAGRVGRE